jgi:cell division protein DivIC
MKNKTPFFRIIKNKYLLTALVFIIWILFFDKNDLFTQRDRKNELTKLENSAAYYQSEIELTKKELADIQNNPAALEKFAREKFYLKRHNEEIFIVEPENSEKN